MTTWLRLTLITITIGGGFHGSVLTFQSLFDSLGQKPLILIIKAIFLSLYAYVTISGLLFVNNPQRTRPLLAALAIQIPWISSPVIVYKFATALQAVLSIGSPEKAGYFGLRLGSEFFLGSSWQFALLQENPWRIGINVFALLLFMLLWRSRRIVPGSLT